MWSSNKYSLMKMTRIIILLVALLGNGCLSYAAAKQETLKSGINIGGSYYEDTEDNIVNHYTFSYFSGTDKWKANLGCNSTNARDNLREQEAKALLLTLDTKYSEAVDLGAGLGFDIVGRGNTTNYLTGMVKADLRILKSKVSAELSKDVLAESAEQIENRIRTTTAGLSISRDLTENLSLSVRYKHKNYSDNNSSNDGVFILKYGVKGDFEVTPGYRFRYLDFDRQSLGGYFDPDNYTSHEIFSSIYIEYEKFYAYMEPFFGYQSFERDGSENNDFIGGAYSTFGLMITKNLSIEVNAEGGNYKVGTPLGDEYYNLDFRTIISF